MKNPLNTNATILKYKINVLWLFALEQFCFIFKPNFRFLLAYRLSIPKDSLPLTNGATLSN